MLLIKLSIVTTEARQQGHFTYTEWTQYPLVDSPLNMDQVHFAKQNNRHLMKCIAL